MWSQLDEAAKREVWATLDERRSTALARGIEHHGSGGAA